jgi:hypothetical protein
VKRFPQRLVLSGLVCALLAALGFAAWGPATDSSQAQPGTIHNCPPAGKWSIAVWDGQSGTVAGDALAACGADAVAAAYSPDAQTGGWWRWFAGKPDVSNLPPLDDKQGVLALGSATAPVATPTVTGTATPQPTATPAATPTGTPPVGVELSQECFQAWTVAGTLEMLIYVQEQAGLPTAYIEAVLKEQGDFLQANCMSSSVAAVPDPTSETLCKDAAALALSLATLIGAAEQEGAPHVYFSQQLDQLNSYIDSYCP